MNINQVSARTKQQRLFPDITFTCNGSITKWIVGVDNASDLDSRVQLQIWRRIVDNVYEKINFTTLVDTGNIKGVYNHTLDSPIEFEKGDILGIYYHHNNSKVLVCNQLTTGPANYWDLNSLKEPPTYNNLSAVLSDEYDYPLVSVEIGEYI